MMWILRKIAPLGLCVCAAAWTQTPPAPAQGNDSAATTAQPAPSSTVTPPTGQESLSKPPEYELEPVAVANVAYPTQAREEKIEGEVVASFGISDTGDVTSVRTVKGDPILARTVEETVSKWKFKPVISGDKAIAVGATASFRFVLNDDDERVNGVVPQISPAGQTTRVRVSKGVEQGLLAHRVQPDYPPDARGRRTSKAQSY